MVPDFRSPEMCEPHVNDSFPGAIIVSTPQDVALSDVRKGIAMLKKVSVPVRSHPCSQ